MTYGQMEQFTHAQLELYTHFQLERIFAVYDRMQTDVDNKTAKGLMNYIDLNRLEENIKTVADEVAVGFVQKTWVVGDLLRVSDYARWKTAVDSIKSAYDVLQTYPSRPFNTFTKWNELEYLLWYTDKIFNENNLATSYCGEFYCGEYGLI